MKTRITPLVLDPLRQLWRSAASALHQHRRRARAERDLRDLDAHALRDIGLSHRAAAERWRSAIAQNP